MDFDRELDTLQMCIHFARAYIGREDWVRALHNTKVCSMTADALFSFQGIMSTAQLVRLKEQTEQCVDILKYLDKVM